MCLHTCVLSGIWFTAVAPVVPELADETDTRHFDEIDEEDGAKKSFQKPLVSFLQFLYLDYLNKDTSSSVSM